MGAARPLRSTPARRADVRCRTFARRLSSRCPPEGVGLPGRPQPNLCLRSGSITWLKVSTSASSVALWMCNCSRRRRSANSCRSAAHSQAAERGITGPSSQIRSAK
ncbi:MAG TPA: hypothetical protein DEG88_11430 [Propionibacteriaceae bacterium]|nr:hypothetical protein [Propionibacteriaceae bacterium]HBY23851.1 hypothetical protein [Propionibacteriaceae bacterium]